MLPFPDSAKSLGVAVAIGILIGLERERRKGDEAGREPAGVRTFTLVAMAGALARLLAEPILLGVAGLLVAGGTLLSYLRTSRTDPGLTTEVALVITFLLGVMAVDDLLIAGGAGALVALILASRTRLHRFIKDTLTTREIEDLLILAAAALVVLPLMPNRGLGPYGAFNPFTLWRLVVLIMAINGAGYIALRTLGARYGLPLAGFFSGFVSSAATVGAMGARSRVNPSLVAPAVAGAILSSCATVVQMLVVVSATSPAAFRLILAPMVAAGGVAVLFGAVAAWRASGTRDPEKAQDGRAFDLKAALLLAGTVSLVMLLASICLRYFGNRGLILAVSLAGLVDTHSAAISAATLAHSGSIAAEAAVIPILCGFTTNTATKILLAWTSGTKAYAGFVTAGVTCMAAAAWAAHALGWGR